MPRTIDIPDVGEVEFPDSMSNAQITSAIQEKILPEQRARALKMADKQAQMKALAEAPDPSVGKLFLQEASQPFVELPKPQVQPDDSSMTRFGKGVVRSGVGLAESIESPMGVSLIAASKLPVVGPVIGRAAAAGFGGLALKGGVEKAVQAYQQGDMEQAGEAAGDLAGGGLVLKGALGRRAASAVTDAKGVPVVEALSGDTRPLVQLPGEEPGVVSAPKAEAAAPAPVDVVPTAPAPANVPAEAASNAPWTSATADASDNLGSQLYAGIPDPVLVAKKLVSMASEAGPYLKKAADATVDATRSAVESIKRVGEDTLKIGDVTDYRRAVLNWSAKLQRSYSEATDAQTQLRDAVISGKELTLEAAKRNVFERDVVKAHLDGITNWIQAAGDADVLKARADATTDPKLKAGYEAALNLTPRELAAAKTVQSAFDALAQRGQRFDVLDKLKENYTPQVWDLGKGPATGGNRTLKERFRFSRASTFPTFFDGEQAGYKPRTKDISQLLPMYLHEMNGVIAARQLVAEMSKGVADDGRPLVAPRGVGVPVEGEANRPVLVMPHATPKGSVETSDYRTLENQPALNKWRWAAADDSGNPILLKSDLALHPDVHGKLRDVLGKSAIKEWYQNKTGEIGDIPKVIMQGIDMAQSETKKLMLGALATFHQIQEGTHAIGHRVNPFSDIPKIDLARDPSQFDAARHGLMLEPDRASANQFMEGFKTSGLLAKVPVLGPLSEWYSNYLFHDYIPGLKYKTYLAALERNKGVYEKELADGSVSPEDVKALSAEQINAAYGHLNYADMARNPTIQHIMQLGLLAPDFLEARARFAGQAAKGAIGLKSGREQALALATLAMAQATGAYVTAQLTGGTWDEKHPFEFHTANRTYTMRSVPEDVSSLLKDARQFTYSRLNPIIGKGLVQGLSGVNWRGEKVTPAETAMELAQQPIPLSLRAMTGTGGKSTLSTWEQLAGTLGLRISRYSADAEMRDVVQSFKQHSADKHIVAEAERDAQETHAHSDYAGFKHALIDGDMEAARKEYAKLLESKTIKQIDKAMKPTHPVSGSTKLEPAFVKSLNEHDKKLYDAVQASHQLMFDRYTQLLQHKE